VGTKDMQLRHIHFIQQVTVILFGDIQRHQPEGQTTKQTPTHKHREKRKEKKREMGTTNTHI